MKALSWDDEPHKYLEKLKPHLAEYGIGLEIESDVSRFLQRLCREKWGFVITDLFSPVVSGAVEEGPSDGVRIANAVQACGLPLFVITKEYDRAVAEAALPPSAVLKSKSTLLPWMAYEIIRDLVRLGVPVSSSRVFIICGQDRKARGATEKLSVFLRQKGIEVDTISGKNLQTEILSGLLDRMNKCAAFVAVCTPDDEWKDGTRHPRQNVLLEIGIALGLSRGLQRLTILQREGPSPELNASLPSDLHGILTMRFADRIDDIFDDLEHRLKKLGVETNGGNSED